MQNTIVNLSNGEFNRNVRTNSSGVFLFDNVTTGSYVLTVYDRGLTNEGVSSNIAVSTGDIHLSCILSDTALAVLYGSNVHHIIEAIFKAFARAMAEAVVKDPRVKGVMSSKGVL